MGQTFPACLSGTFKMEKTDLNKNEQSKLAENPPVLEVDGNDYET
jgi:hypothetical protein